MASLDEYFKKRMGSVATPTENPAPAVDTKPDPASTYIDRISKTLSGNDPVVKNARQEASTKNAVGDYLANRQAKQESVGAGYTPGTLQSQRTADRYQAGANESALARDAGVNQFARDQTNTAMSQANELRQEGRQDAETLRQEGRQDIETLINSVKDPVTQAYLRRVQAAGGDVRGALAGNLGTNPSGGVAPTSPTTPGGTTDPNTPIDPNTGLPISKTPAQLAQESAQDWVKTLHPEMDPNTPEFQELVQARVGGADEAALSSITDANKARAKTQRNEKALTSGLQALSDAEYNAFLNDLPITSAGAIPTDKAGIDALKASGTPFVKTNDGQVYQIQDYLQATRWENGGKDRHSDYAVGIGRDGKQVWINTEGQIIPYKPPNAPKGMKIKYDPATQVFRLYYGSSGGSRGQHYDPNTQKWVDD